MLKEKRNTSKYVKKVPQKYLEKEVSAKKLQKCMSKKKDENWPNSERNWKRQPLLSSNKKEKYEWKKWKLNFRKIK